MLKRLDRYVFNSLKVAITGMCWYALFAIPYDKVFEASIEAKIIFGLLVWSIWSFMTMIVELQDDGGKVTTWKSSGKVTIKSKTYGFDVEIPYRRNDDIVWRGKLSANYLEKNSNIPNRFGDTSITFVFN